MTMQAGNAQVRLDMLVQKYRKKIDDLYIKPLMFRTWWQFYVGNPGDYTPPEVVRWLLDVQEKIEHDKHDISDNKLLDDLTYQLDDNATFRYVNKHPLPDIKQK